MDEACISYKIWKNKWYEQTVRQDIKWSWSLIILPKIIMMNNLWVNKSLLELQKVFFKNFLVSSMTQYNKSSLDFKSWKTSSSSIISQLQWNYEVSRFKLIKKWSTFLSFLIAFILNYIIIDFNGPVKCSDV